VTQYITNSHLVYANEQDKIVQQRILQSPYRR